MQICGIYKDPDIEEYSLSDGKNLFLLFDGITDIETDVEIAVTNPGIHMENYCLSINKLHKKWKIKDTGFRGCKDVIAEGSYSGNFEKSMGRFLKMLNK